MLSLLVLLTVMLLALTIFYFWASSATLPETKYSQLIFIPSASPPENSPVFTVLTYNIGYLSGMTNNLPVQPDPSLYKKNAAIFIQQLKTHPPDFFAVQEIDYFSRRSYYIDQLFLFMKEAAYPYAAKAINWDKRYVPFPYWPPAVQFGRILAGQAVVSKYPILSAARIVLPKPKNSPFYYNAFYLDRLVQVVKIKIQTRILVLLNVHLEAFDLETRQIQADQVLNIYRSYQNDFPVLLIGDFNALPPDALQKKNFSDEPQTDYSTDTTIQLFLNEPGLKSALPLSSPFTFPSDVPTRKLDYIFYNGEKITCLGAEVIHISSSDHLPFAMRFTFNPGV